MLFTVISTVAEVEPGSWCSFISNGFASEIVTGAGAFRIDFLLAPPMRIEPRTVTKTMEVQRNRLMKQQQFTNNKNDILLL
jgi:hypothetical protein